MENEYEREVNECQEDIILFIYEKYWIITTKSILLIIIFSTTRMII
jgi:hypothetical protein